MCTIATSTCTFLHTQSSDNNDKLRAKALRFSLHETDLDAALAGHSLDVSTEVRG